MRCLITGGSGFLGSHLVDYLVAKDHQVVVVDNYITGSPQNLQHYTGRPEVDVRVIDAATPFDIDGDLDLVFHFASPASPRDFARIPLDVLKAGSYATHNTLELAHRKGARYFLASTSEVYGDPLVNPQPETYWGNVNSVGPRSCYDEAKRYAEAATIVYRDHYGLDVRIVRFFNTYGPRMRLDDGRVVPNFIHQALLGEPLTVYGDGSQTRSFGFYADIIDGVYRLAMSNFTEPVNLGTHEERTILQFAEAVIAAVGSSSTVIHLDAAVDDPKQRHPDITRAETILDWHPSTPLSEGLEKTIAFFRATL
jgi:dTDP-glucose 4,6-dehydratase